MNIKIDGLLERLGIKSKDTIGIAFSGGGARGFSHIGVLKAFEQFGLKPSVLSGVSAGSIAAVLYGAGLTPDEMAKCFKDASRFNDFTEWAIPTDGVFKLNKFAKLLTSWLPVNNLEDLKIPTVVCATNLDKGSSVGWAKGPIVERVLASCSIPIVFKPVKINGSMFVDGGVLRNLPAWAIRRYCTTLYGSNCSPLNPDYKYKPSVLDIAMRTYQLMAKANVLQDLKLCDYVIAPREMHKIKTFDLESIDNNIEQGYSAACKVLERALR